MRKHFDRALYDKCDSLAKDKAIKVLRRHGLDVVENPDKVGVDLLVYKNDELLFNVETEIKLVWDGPKFPYENIQFPLRKHKFAILEKPTLFLMFNKDLSKYVAVNSDDLIRSPIEIVRNKFVKYGEYFYQVNLANSYNSKTLLALVRKLVSKGKQNG